MILLLYNLKIISALALSEAFFTSEKKKSILLTWLTGSNSLLPLLVVDVLMRHLLPPTKMKLYAVRFYEIQLMMLQLIDKYL